VWRTGWRLEAAAESGSEEELRSQIVELEEDVKTAREAAERWKLAPSAPGDRELAIYIPSHSVAGDRVSLTLDVPPASVFPSPYTCGVRAPGLRTVSSKPITVPYSVMGGRRKVTVVYPHDFEGAPSLTPGAYSVEWRRRSPFGASIVMLRGDLIIALDTFLIEGSGQLRGNQAYRARPKSTNQTGSKIPPISGEKSAGPKPAETQASYF